MKASVAAQEAQRHTLVPSSRSTTLPFAVFQPQLLHVRLSFPVICTQGVGDGGTRLPRMGERRSGQHAGLSGQERAVIASAPAWPTIPQTLANPSWASA
jgi:hypothetical protein